MRYRHYILIIKIIFQSINQLHKTTIAALKNFKVNGLIIAEFFLHQDLPRDGVFSRAQSAGWLEADFRPGEVEIEPWILRV